MSVINTQPLAGASGSQVTGYNLTKSLRFRSSASAYLNRTPSSTSGTQKYTISMWLKRGKLGAYVNPIGSACPNPPFGNTFDGLRFNSSDQLEFCARGGNDIYVVPSMLFRDTAAWYHIIVAVDTTQATASNRVKFYVNGVLQTAFYSATYPSQNYNMLGWNVSGYASSIGSDPANLGTSVCDSYMAEINVISGTQELHTAFGETDSITGVWKPKRYTGTYGTNGFYLPFTDVATTSGSNAGLGKDFSGNGNYWTTNNISVTAGSTYDSMTDVPTLTSATAANYCVLNPLQTPATVKFANLGFAGGGDDWYPIVGTIGVSSGKWYWEVVFNANFTFGMTGIAPTTYVPAKGTFPGSTATSYGYWSNNGNKYNNGTSTSYGASYTGGDVIGVALDMDAGTLTFYKNNTSQGTAYSSLTGSFVPAIAAYVDCTANFGQQPFAYTPPTGFKALNTYNLPDSTIVAGNKNFDVALWTGDAASPKTVYSGLAFQPDFVWAKTRSTSTQHALYDSVRGAGSGKILLSNTTDAEGGATGSTSDAQYGYLSAFNSNGISTVTGSSGTNYFFNNNTVTYAAWNWKAGQGTTSSNTSGSITSTVSVNASAGFSIVTWTGTGSAATVGHGLGVAPKMIIAKVRGNAGYDWNSYHASLGATQYINLNTTAAAATASSVWNNTAPTSSVFSVANNGGTNGSGENLVAYCWSEIAGFSAFGRYTGNGSADGPFIYTGFKPKFVIYKRTDSTGSWFMVDSSRNTYNVANYWLQANTSDAEQTDGAIDFLSNGYKVRGTGTGTNASGGTYIYMAFAENPFKNSLAR